MYAVGRRNGGASAGFPGRVRVTGERMEPAGGGAAG